MFRDGDGSIIALIKIEDIDVRWLSLRMPLFLLAYSKACWPSNLLSKTFFTKSCEKILTNRSSTLVLGNGKQGDGEELKDDEEVCATSSC